MEDLRTYCREQKDKSLADADVYLLRNLSRGKGIGFFENRGFYPDFILWIKKGNSQRIVFVEPHGMVYAGAYTYDDKARLHESLPALATEMCKRTGLKDISLDSFIVSATSYEDLREKYDDGTWDRRKFAVAHILFAQCESEYSYIKMIMDEHLKGPKPSAS